MTRTIRPLWVLLTLSACAGQGDGGLSMRFEDANMAVATEAARAENSQVKGLYYGELEVVAYDYRPGESVQANSDWSLSGSRTQPSADWSYLIPLQAGYDQTRDQLLRGNGSIDFSTLAADASRVTVPAAFESQVGAFDIDFLEVVVHRTGVLYDPVGSNDEDDFIYVGMNAEGNGLEKHPLHLYPTLTGIDDAFAYPYFPTWSQIGWLDSGFQQINVLFADDDLFAENRSVVLDNNPAYESDDRVDAYIGVKFDSLDGTPQALTTAQRDLILSLANQGTGRRRYDHILIVPMPGPVRIVYNAQVAAGLGGSPSQTLQATGWQIDVRFDIDDILDEDHSVITTTAVAPKATFAIDAIESPGTYTITLDGIDYSVTTDAGLTTLADLCNNIHTKWSALQAAATGRWVPNGTCNETVFEVQGHLVPLEPSTSDPKLRLTAETELAPWVTYSGDAAMVPFGLEVAFGSRQPECPVGTPFDASASCHGLARGTTRPPTCCVCPSGTVYGPVPGGKRQCA